MCIRDRHGTCIKIRHDSSTIRNLYQTKQPPVTLINDRFVTISFLSKTVQFSVVICAYRAAPNESELIHFNIISIFLTSFLNDLIPILFYRKV